jgi:hypothetical protein
VQSETLFVRTRSSGLRFSMLYRWILGIGHGRGFVLCSVARFGHCRRLWLRVDCGRRRIADTALLLPSDSRENTSALLHRFIRTSRRVCFGIIDVCFSCVQHLLARASDLYQLFFVPIGFVIAFSRDVGASQAREWVPPCTFALVFCSCSLALHCVSIFVQNTHPTSCPSTALFAFFQCSRAGPSRGGEWQFTLAWCVLLRVGILRFRIWRSRRLPAAVLPSSWTRTCEIASHPYFLT